MKSGNLSDRERLILAHIGRFRLTFNEIVSHVFLGGGDPKDALGRLIENGYVQSQAGLFKGNRRPYVLRPKGAALAQTGRRSAELGSKSLHLYVQILSFCFLKRRPRLRLLHHEVEELFPEGVPPGDYHCLERSAEASRVYHIYAPEPTLSPKEVVKATRTHLADTLKIRHLRSWIKYKLYSYAILVDEPDRQAEIDRVVEQTEYVEGQPLRRVAHVLAECVPGMSSVEEALHVFAKTAKEN